MVTPGEGIGGTLLILCPYIYRYPSKDIMGVVCGGHSEGFCSWGGIYPCLDLLWGSIGEEGEGGIGYASRKLLQHLLEVPGDIPPLSIHKDWNRIQEPLTRADGHLFLTPRVIDCRPWNILPYDIVLNRMDIAKSYTIEAS